MFIVSKETAERLMAPTSCFICDRGVTLRKADRDVEVRDESGNVLRLRAELFNPNIRKFLEVVKG